MNHPNFLANEDNSEQLAPVIEPSYQPPEQPPESPLELPPEPPTPAHHPRKKRRWVLWSLLSVLGVFFIIVGVGLTRLIDGGLQAKKALDEAQVVLQDADFDAAADALDDAAHGIQRAQTGAAMLFFVRPLPWVGDKFQAGEAVLSALDKTVEVLVDAVAIGQDIASVVDGADALLSLGGDSGGGSGFDELSAETKAELFHKLSASVPELREMQIKLALAQEDLERFHDLDLDDSFASIVAPFEETLDDLKDGVDMIAPFAAIAEEFAGLGEDRQFLIMMLNETELRPGGGFMGNYGLLVTRDGDIKSLEVDDSYDVDEYVTDKPDYHVAPPAPIATYLKQPNWWFRDCTWSPDYPTTVETCVQLLRQEMAYGGQPVPEIHGAIAMTTKFIARLLDLTGPVTVDGQEFNSENVYEVLEYEVEIGYVHDGISENDRKKLVSDLADEVMERVKSLSPSEWPDVMRMFHDAFEAKEFAVYSANKETQLFLEDAGWAAHLDPTTADDVLMVVDANLGGYKSDPVVERTITYSLAPTRRGYQATVSIFYDHHGFYDWKTTDYKTYTRVYAPAGSRLLDVEGAGGWGTNGVTEQDLGMTSFGAYFSTPPQTSGTLTFTYLLPSSVETAIKNGTYELQVFKQLGADNHHLELDLDFGDTVLTATPAESESEWGDDTFTYTTDIETNTTFTVRLE